MPTPHQAKYYAYELTKRCPSNSVEKFSTTLLDAQVDLNPHLVEAAFFAAKSPLSNGAILSDKVGLGKTIEAGILRSQKWAEGNCRLIERQVNEETNMQALLDIQKKSSDLKKKQHRQRSEKFDVEGEIEAQRDEMIQEFEMPMQREVSEQPLFAIRWKLE